MQSFPKEEIHCKGMMERTKKIDGVTNYYKYNFKGISKGSENVQYTYQE